MMNFLKEAENLYDELTALRHSIHRRPEIGGREFLTASLIEQYLNGLGIKTERLSATAILGTLEFDRPGKTIAFRADMDALPVTEITGCDFASETPGIMHACGHDVHTSALLGTAKLLSLHKSELSGCVKFFFEPDEEGDGGAGCMIDAGCMEGVSAVYGAHMDPALELGSVGVRYGKFYAASNMFNVTIHGKSAHGAMPEKGIDALLCAAKIICALKELPKSFPEGEAVLSVGTIASGSARNIIADTAVFTGIIRTLGNDVRDGMLYEFKKIINDVCASFGAAAETEMISTHNGIVNTQKETDLAKEAFEGIDGIKVVEIEKPLMISEDFGYFIDEAAGSFYHIGAGSSHCLHSASFLPDDRAVIITAAAHTAVAFKELS